MKQAFNLLVVFFIAIPVFTRAQTVTDLAPGHYVAITIPATSPYKDYAKAVILLHAIYDGEVIGKNYTAGTLVALRGPGVDRTNVAYINTSSAYRWTHGSITSINNHEGTSYKDEQWKLKKVRYNGILYMALEVPYRAYYHNMGFRFVGWTYSTAPENMKLIAYEDTKSGGAGIINEEIYNSMEDYIADNTEYHRYFKSVFGGKVGIGTDNPDAELTVKGTVHARKVKVDMDGVLQPDYVFDSTYHLPSLSQLKEYINTHHHLPGIASAKQVQSEGLDLGGNQTRLLQKIEELTLYVIDLNEKMQVQNETIKTLRKALKQLKKQ